MCVTGHNLPSSDCFAKLVLHAFLEKTKYKIGRLGVETNLPLFHIYLSLLEHVIFVQLAGW